MTSPESVLDTLRRYGYRRKSTQIETELSAKTFATNRR